MKQVGDRLTVLTGALATRVVFDRQHAREVEFTVDGQKRHVRASREIILSGGAINSPQLLMLSGIGPADELTRHGIPVIHHSPGVGRNLQDHLEVYIQYRCTQPITLYKYQWRFPLTMIRTGLQWFLASSGSAATSHLESGAFIRSRPDIQHPDIQFHLLPSVIIDHGQKMGTCHAFQAHVGTLRETSRGQLTLRSRSPEDPPVIDPNYLDTDDDVYDLRACIHVARQVFAQRAFDPYRGVEVLPGPEVTTDKALDAFVRAAAETAYHPSCTCRMGSPGTDLMVVVDPQCRVVGVEGLRVVDASIMPSVISGNLNGPVIMMAEKAADMILGLEALPPSASTPVHKPQETAAAIDKKRI
jgi:choline dehydrogenase